MVGSLFWGGPLDGVEGHVISPFMHHGLRDSSYNSG